MNLQRTCFVLVTVVLGHVSMARSAEPTMEWIRQLGTSLFDFSAGVSADGLGNVYISGSTFGSLGGPNAGKQDAFVSKYDATGSLLWTRQLGTSSVDYSTGVSADGVGNIYISGLSQGDLGGTYVGGGGDAFLSKFDAAGSHIWTRQLGTDMFDTTGGISADRLGNIYITGYTAGSLGGTNAGQSDAFVGKYDAAGSLLWVKQLGTVNDDVGTGVSADSLGNVYITGYTMGSLGGTNAGQSDAFVSKYDASGTPLWTRQLGTSQNDNSFGVSADSLGNVFITGRSTGGVGGANEGSNDAFVRKYNAEGSHLWTRRLGTSTSDESQSVSVDGLGNVYIAGDTGGNLGSFWGEYSGFQDAFVSKYDSNGSLSWTQQLGTSGWDYSTGVSTDRQGNVYILGTTGGSLGGPNAGEYDAFVVKFSDPIPEPLSGVLAILALAITFAGRGARRASRLG